MNPFAGVSWFWRAWRARSITFAALFAFSVLGVSVLGLFRQMLREIGAPWYVWLVVPFAAVMLLARKEADWVPEANERRKWALRIVLGAIVVAVLVARLGLRREPETPAPMSAPGSGRADPHGH
jgi:membrane protease YdiL (CAAX protease family)